MLVTPSLPVADVDGSGVARLEFVEVRAAPGDVRDPALPSQVIGGSPTPGSEPGWSLWGDPDH